MKKNLALFFGGVSGEHEVSRISAASIFKNLDRNHYEVFPIGISKSGRWYLQETAQAAAAAEKGALCIEESQDQLLTVIPGQGIFTAKGPLTLDVAFLITHGTNGEDGKLQGLLSLIGLPFTGAGVLGSALGMDKAMVKEVWIHHELPVVPFVTAWSHLDKRDKGYARSLYSDAERTWGLPLFVKPANSGSSVGVSRATNFTEFETALKLAFSVDKKILIEPAVDAREIEIAVLGTIDPTAFVPGEILPSHDFYDYEAKYTDPNGATLLIPARISDDEAEKIKTLAIEAYLACDCAGFARVDFFLDRKTGKLYINEINTLPGFTTISMFPRMCMAGGLTYPQILDRIVEDALSR